MTAMTPGLLGGLALLVICTLGLLSVVLSDDGLAMWRIRLRRYYRVGDMVTLGEGFHGRVSALSLFTTTLLTPRGEHIRLGNRAVLNSPIILHPAGQTSMVAPPVTPALALPLTLSETPELAEVKVSPAAEPTGGSPRQTLADVVTLTTQSAPVTTTSAVAPDLPGIDPIESPAPTVAPIAVAPLPTSDNATGLRLPPMLPLLHRAPLGRHTLRPLRAVLLPTSSQLPSAVAQVVTQAIATPTHDAAILGKRRWPNAMLRRRATSAKAQ